MAKMIKTISSLFCFASLLSLLFYTNKAKSQTNHIYMTTICNGFSENFTDTSQYQTNLAMLLSLLRTSSSGGLYDDTTVGIDPDTVYGMFFCRGDMTQTSCWNCVVTATNQISKNCTHEKAAFIFYEECMVRYSNTPFLTLVEDRPYVASYSSKPAPDSVTFKHTLSGKMDELIVQASSSSSYFVEDEERVKLINGSYDLDSMVQCSPDLDSSNCTVCLKEAVKEIMDCCTNYRWAQYFLSKCLVRFEATALSSPPLFSQPSSGASFSRNIIKGTRMFLRIFIAVVTVYVSSSFFGL